MPWGRKRNAEGDGGGMVCEKHSCLFFRGKNDFFFPYKIHRRAGEMAQWLRYSEVMVGCLSGGSGISCVKEAEKKNSGYGLKSQQKH